MSQCVEISLTQLRSSDSGCGTPRNGAPPRPTTSKSAAIRPCRPLPSGTDVSRQDVRENAPRGRRNRMCRARPTCVHRRRARHLGSRSGSVRCRCSSRVADRCRPTSRSRRTSLDAGLASTCRRATRHRLAIVSAARGRCCLLGVVQLAAGCDVGRDETVPVFVGQLRVSVPRREQRISGEHYASVQRPRRPINRSISS